MDPIANRHDSARETAEHLDPRAIGETRAFSEGDGDEAEQPADAAEDVPGAAIEPTRDDGGKTEPGTRYDFELNGNEDDQVIQLLFPNREGDRLGQWGSFEIQRELGRGGMGIVFKGFDFVLHRDVAIKVMNPTLAVSERSRTRFEREARAMAAVSHPNVVTIHAVNQHKGVPYLVMEYIPGEGLDQRILRGGRPAVSEVLRIGAQIADGLAAAHDQGTIHRDVKPSNVMLETGVDRVKIGDFGLARAALENSDLTPADRMLGTPAYMAPERIMGKAVDARSDLFSLGCVIHAMVAGCSPFDGKHVINAVHRVCNETPQRLDEIDPSIPGSLADLTLRLLEKDPANRIQTAREAALAMRRLLAAEGSAPPVPIVPLRAEGRPRRRLHWRARPWVLGGGVLIAALILFPPLGGFAPRWPWSSPSSPPPPLPLPASGAGPMQLVVSARSSAHFRSLAEAIAHATPGSTIQLLEGEYQGTIRIDDPEKSRGLIIEAAAGAVLRTGSSSIAVVEIRDAPGVVIRGLTIRCSSPNQHGVVFYGDVAGARLEAVRIEQADGARAAAVYATPGTHGAPDAPLRLRGLDVAAGGLGIVLGSSMGTQPVSFVRVEDCRIRGEGFLVVLETAVHDAILTGNIFAGGESALSLALTHARTPANIEVRNNTFFDCGAWVNLGYTSAAIEGIAFTRNLILNCDSVATRTIDLAVVGPLWFRENLWRKSGAEVGLVARSIADAPLLSTDPTSPDYLRPADAASVSVTDAASGKAGFAGAVAPRSAARAAAGFREDPHL